MVKRIKIKMRTLKITSLTLAGLTIALSFLLLLGLESTHGEMMADADADMAAGNGNGNVGCDNCGSECVKKCGTRLFRPCCFHFVRKRNPLMFLNMAKHHKMNSRAMQEKLNDLLFNTVNSSYDTDNSVY